MKTVKKGQDKKKTTGAKKSHSGSPGEAASIDPVKLRQLMGPALDAVARDPRGLVAKISDLFKARSWLYNIKKAHGSVETSAVDQ
jgi:hypothetical protein